MTLRIRLSLFVRRWNHRHRRWAMTTAPERGGLYAQRGHCQYRKLSERP
ncbi:hypothetical protein HDG35_004374 [Paraburkholderia sp. JPY681]|nr:hypothetical protein [Paraburkholderia atlantica]